MNRYILILILFCISNLGAYQISAQTFQIDSAKSEIRILLYREGIFSNLAHNHVLVGKNVSGAINLEPSLLSQSVFEIKIPVLSILVDEPEHRKQEGSSFDSFLSQQDKEEIRETMLSPKILDVEKYPYIEIRSTALSGSLPLPKATVQIKIRNATQHLTFPVNVDLQETSLTARGEVTLKQTDFGIEPIQLFLGTIQVKDSFLVKFHIIARAAGL